ncbi:MAG: pyridoxal phosphate-dependent aminotransferase [Muribaculaceae bacterium]|nr:pyridoxal phosphate-dependent aminotransferase [Muribaculaceae bacterium]
MKPIDHSQFEQAKARLSINDLDCATIRQISALANILEQMAGEEYIHLELGNPGLASDPEGVDAQVEALRSGVANKYPNIVGIKPLKDNGSRFVKAFLDVDVPPEGVIPTVGSMQGSFTLMLLLGQRIPGKDTMLFIDPGFPAQHHQAKVLGLKTEAFDIYQYRGAALRDKLEGILAKGHITGIIYSNPNNPAWTNLTDEELRIIGELATKYDAIVLEDLAYLGMDFRHDFSRPGVAPFIPSVAKYTDNCILMLSASKIFSYAGERIAIMCMTRSVYERQYDALRNFYDLPSFGDAYAFGVLYTASSGVCHSAQHAMAKMLGKAADGELDFVSKSREYGRRAGLAKEIFLRHGFHLAYEKDGDEPISDGFFFTLGYGDLPGNKLAEELLRYGISTIPLKSTGSEQPGVRVTVSMLCGDDMFKTLDQRLKAFNDEH